jgi:hypothetical protein
VLGDEILQKSNGDEVLSNDCLEVKEANVMLNAM